MLLKFSKQSVKLINQAYTSATMLVYCVLFSFVIGELMQMFLWDTVCCKFVKVDIVPVAN